MLLSEYKIKDILIKNRICMPPMITCHAVDGFVQDFHLVHYGIRSDLGVGMIILEATSVLEDGRITLEDLGIWSDDYIEGLSRITKYLNNNNTLSCIQLAHAGRKAHNDLAQVAPSSIAFDEKYNKPDKLSIEEIENIIIAFKESAVRAKKAGFDAIEIHAAHGYLINQFLSPLTNKRDDFYGGNFENRFRLLKTIIEEVKKVYNGLVFVRISAEEYAEGGLHIEDHLLIAKELENLSVDLIDVSSGGVVPYEYNIFPGYQVDLSRKVKEVVNIPVTAVGLLNDHDIAENVLNEGKADIIQFGRKLLRNPMFAKNAADSLGEVLEMDFPYSRVFK
ncbi:NADPH dehydrogenase NamA [Mycoplasmatota bacterium WC44]